MIECNSCKVENTEGSIVCESCHEPITTTPETEGYLCPVCGAVIEEGDKFCTECGQSLNNNYCFEEPDDNERTLSLEDGTVIASISAGESKSIGRSSDCDICLSHLPDADTLSRKHARLETEKDGVLVEDLNSLNGTFLDGKVVPPGRPSVATPDSKIELGKIVLTVS